MYVLFLSQLSFFWVSIVSPEERELQFPVFCLPVAFPWQLNLLAFGFCLPGQDPLALGVSSLQHRPAQFPHCPACFWLCCSTFLHTSTPMAPFYQTGFGYLKIPIGFLFSVAYATPFPSCLWAKGVMGFGFPPWPPRIPTLPHLFKQWCSLFIPFIPQNIVGLLSPGLMSFVGMDFEQGLLP